MAPEAGNTFEAEGVLNPAAVRGRDNQLYLLPRLVAKGNYSRIGLARVRFNGNGDPAGVERLGVALEPRETYEKNPVTGGGVEDPRVTFLEPFDRYIMTYTAYGPTGPRIAFAVSKDLHDWERLGLARFEPGPVDFNGVNNKDAVVFPRLVSDASGRPSLALIHRPRFPGSTASLLPALLQPDVEPPASWNGHRPRFDHESLWISYCEPVEPFGVRDFGRHHRLLSPRASWERMKVGAGAPPILTGNGWLLIYHGVSTSRDATRLRYSAGAVILDGDNPERVLYRTRRPILAPAEEDEFGVVPGVVFPTAIDRRTDIGLPNRVDMYYGMADTRIGVARLTLPHVLR